MKIITFVLACVAFANFSLASEDECSEKVKSYAIAQLKELTGETHFVTDEPESIAGIFEYRFFKLTLENAHTGQQSTWSVKTAILNCEPLSINEFK